MRSWCCRCLAGFESDPHKRCVMHRARAKLLQPLEGQLSPTHYPGLSRSISLELGNISREVADIKAAAGREPDKVGSTGRGVAVWAYVGMRYACVNVCVRHSGCGHK
jgi:hypothetical protein